MKLRNSVAAGCLALPLALNAVAAHAAGEVNLFHRSSAESARTPRMAMWNHCAEKLDITIVENFSPPEQYEVQLPVQLSSSNPPDIYALWAGGRAQFQAETGKIMGDLNLNGVRDAGEDYFALFRIVDEGPAPNGDVNDDGAIDVRDLDAICSAIRASQSDGRYDMNQDGLVNHSDHEYHLSAFLGTTIGDSNLDGVVNSSDLVTIFRAGRYEKLDGPDATWEQGDWDCDGRFTSSDLVALFAANVYDRN